MGEREYVRKRNERKREASRKNERDKDKRVTERGKQRER